MFANPNWFSIRKYGGWGLTPNCWQGWAYIATIALPLIFINFLPLPEAYKPIIMFVWVGIFTLDFLIIMFRLKKDERESIHEALAERNAMWFMVATLIVGVAYQTASGIVKNIFEVDPIILVALGGAVIVKSATHLYLRDK